MNYAHLAGVVVASGFILAASHALAQAAAPATPPAGVQPSGPLHLDLKPLQPKWTKLCSLDPTVGNKQTCLTNRDFTFDQQTKMALSVYATDGIDKHLARLLLPNGMLLKPGFQIVLDKSDPIDGHYTICLPTYCIGEVDFEAPILAAMKKAQTLSVVTRNQGNNEVTMTAPIADFGAAFDGPAIDPKTMQQQEEARQNQLAEEARKQRDLLQQLSQKGLQPPPGPVAPSN